MLRRYKWPKSSLRIAETFTFIKESNKIWFALSKGVDPDDFIKKRKKGFDASNKLSIEQFIWKTT